MTERKTNTQPADKKSAAGSHVKPSGDRDEQHVRKSGSGADKPKRDEKK